MFVAVDAVLAVRAAGHLSARFWRYPDDNPQALRVEVTARQWSWTFRTAGPDRRFATPDDVVTLNELHVPLGRPVYLKLRSKDVVHSLYLPNFRTKLDAIPGSTTRLWFEARETGRFEIGCAQHCGVSHYKMRGLLAVESEEDYARWLARAEVDSRLRFEPAAPGVTPGWWDLGWDWESGR
jgi:cytochrome c oxidase subunit 2